MSVKKAFEALKIKDFSAARTFMAGEDPAAFDIPHFLVKGLAELALEDWPASLTTFTAATARFPDYALFWLNRGIAEENLEQVSAAVASQEKCIALNPAQGEAYGNLANLYRKLKRYVLSEKMARKALELGTLRGDALNSLGLALGKQGKHGEADIAFQESAKEMPANPFVAANRANLAIDRLRFEEAWPFFAQARSIEDRPVFRRDEGMAHMLSGDFERGWKLYEARLQMLHALRHCPTIPAWNGESLNGKKLLIIAEQGFGDVIQFCRYHHFLPATAELIWAVPQNLVRLLTSNVRGQVFYENDPLPICDYYAPIMSLPLLTGHMLPEPTAPYLRAPSAPELPRGHHNRKIGLVWAGSRTHERDHERSIPLSFLWDGIKDIPADFYAPFTGDGLNEIHNLPIVRLDSLIKDFADTAALVSQIDLLITVDTAVAHLAGALGIKTFLLLPYCADWRWGTVDETTKWYSSLTLLRQPKYGDWISVVELLKRRL